jgi:hypothetical protein
MSSFDFDSFAQDESFQSQINDLMQPIQDQGDPELANRFADLRRRHKIENEEDPPPNFHFVIGWAFKVNQCGKYKLFS